MDDRTLNPRDRHRVVIVGGGFGGLYAAKALAGANVDVTLVDRRNHHLFQPLLYQVATGGLSPAHIAQPLRSLLAKAKNVHVMLDEVVDLDPAARRVSLRETSLPYDSLIVAAGADTQYFGNDDWRSDAPSLKSIEDALDIRHRILCAFERAEQTRDSALRKALLTFVVVGGGPTGVELAGALGEIANYTLREDFRTIDPSEARILLIEGGGRVLPAYSEKLSASGADSLKERGVTVVTDTFVDRVTDTTVDLRDSQGTRTVACHTTLWAAGVKASSLAAVIAERTGARIDRAGRIVVEDTLALSSFDNVFIIGDMAHCEDNNGDVLPGVAPVAMQQGRHVASNVRRRLRGEAVKVFSYKDRGSMATIGRSRAVADLGWIEFSGFPAWMAWLFIHLFYLAAFENRVMVFTQWAWNYATWSRGARLITPLVPSAHAHTRGAGDDDLEHSERAA